MARRNDHTFGGLMREITERITLLERRVVRLGDRAPRSGGNIAGSVSMFAGSIAPSGYFICDGSSFDPVANPKLYAAIGTTYGGTAGAPLLPNLKGRVVVGQDASQGEFNTLGETGGAKTHALSVAEMPSHNHGGSTSDAGSHSHGASTGSAGTHDHLIRTQDDGTYITGTSGDRELPSVGSGSFRYVIEGLSGSTRRIVASSDGAHTHSVTVNSAGTHNHTISAQGSGAAHNNLQPYIAMNYIIAGG